MGSSTQELGLPIEYRQLPQYFDAHNIQADTEAKNALIESLLKKYHVHRVYDITCGTGSQTLYLAQKGYAVLGTDLCPDLIDQAKVKAKQLNLSVHFDVADMRTTYQGQFDAVISIFSAIGHLSTPDFGLALHAIANNLKPGGYYIFDIFNLEALTDEVITTFVMDIESEAQGIYFQNQQRSELDRDQGLLISHDHYTIREDGHVKSYQNTFALQIYTIAQMRAQLESHGFTMLEVLDLEGQLFLPEFSLNMLIVAQKQDSF